ncbi:hypothetical protein PHYBOEH_010281 [Phytophthora boehmeriae]|uniref:PH domain-containing protein n=1 Tax=Phytophthora boehmeriae TaxID=109152 RepID=A0A8T1XC02_9STRA|nr:hypothetical protein PHYBOEH_010281 [Phytophthora boehmeriae]
MADSVTISSSVAVRSVRDEEHGIHEYLEEHHPVPESPERTLALPVRLSGWLWRREGFGFFRRYRRRFCVFKAEQSALFVFSDDDTVNGKVLRRLVLTKVALTSRTERSFVVQGYLADRELHKQASDSMASKVSSLKKGVLPGDQQRFYMPEEEKLKAVSQKACSVWTHCFKYHMRSYALRQPRDEAESESQEEVEEDPDFVFEDVRKSRRRHSMGSALRSGSTISSSMLSASRPRSRSKGKVGVVVRPRGQTESEKRESDQFGHDRACGSTSRLDKELTASVASEGGKDQEPEKEELLEEESSTLPCVSSIFEDEELLSHSIDFDTIVKKDMLASGALGEVWIAMHRSQEVVVKNLRDDATLSARLKGDDKTATRRRHQAFLDFVEEIRITSRTGETSGTLASTFTSSQCRRSE